MFKSLGIGLVESVWFLFLFGVALGMVKQAVVSAANSILKSYLEEKKNFLQELEDRYQSFGQSNRNSMYQ